MPLGVLWRRVYEINGGEWTNTGEAWMSTVFAYNLSIACNHCVHPKCAGVCPTDAFEVRADGIVLINPEKCIGCGYCAWACPYDAPQLNNSAGYMTKCNLCYDNLDAGLLPACVAACPLRCLELVRNDDQNVDKKGLPLWKIQGAEHPFPLPKRSRTEPHLVIKPHPAVKQVGKGTVISNREEISPTQPHLTARGEIPLILFTLLAQMAIGAFVTIFIIYLGLSNKLLTRPITLIPLLAVGAGITSAFLISFFHLKNPRNAWRAMNHLRKSWLSREIFFTAGFTGAWAIITAMRIFQIGSFSLWIGLAALTGLIGVAGVYSMQRVYQLRSMLAWNSNRTFLEFFISTVGLGSLLTAMLLPGDTPAGVITCIALAAMLAFSSCMVIISIKYNENKKLMEWRAGLLLASLLVLLVIAIWPSSIRMGSMVLVFFSALAEEVIGRWLFYSRRNPGI